jgi:hypothetical protein
MGRWVRHAVGSFDDLEVAALLPRTAEHDAAPAAVALECDNRHALDLALR